MVSGWVKLSDNGFSKTLDVISSVKVSESFKSFPKSFIVVSVNPVVAESNTLLNVWENASSDKEKRMISGALMISDLPIYRKDEMGEYYVVFDKGLLKLYTQSFG